MSPSKKTDNTQNSILTYMSIYFYIYFSSMWMLNSPFFWFFWSKILNPKNQGRLLPERQAGATLRFVAGTHLRPPAALGAQPAALAARIACRGVPAARHVVFVKDLGSGWGNGGDGKPATWWDFGLWNYDLMNSMMFSIHNSTSSICLWMFMRQRHHCLDGPWS